MQFISVTHDAFIACLISCLPACVPGFVGWKQRNAKSGPDYAVPATAAVGGLVALTGSLISYAVARARSSRREQRLKGEAVHQELPASH
jgi:hypothetical protein